MRTVRNIASFVAFGVIIGIAAVYIGSFGLRMGLPENRINLSMEVPDIKGLAVGSSVLVRGVAVGEVTGISSSVDRANIEFYIAGDQPVPVESDVRLENLSALGETYIGFFPRTAEGPMLSDGQHLEAERITVPASISELATSVVAVLNQMDPDELKRIVDEADAGLPDSQVVLPNLERASRLTRNMVAGLDGKGQEVLVNFQSLLENAGWVGPALAEATPYVHPVGIGIQGTFQGMMNIVAWQNPRNIELFQKYLDRIQDFLDTRAPDLQVIGNSLLPQFQGIGGALMNFDTAQILSNALKGIPEEGAITLRVTIPDR